MYSETVIIPMKRTILRTKILINFLLNDSTLVISDDTIAIKQNHKGKRYLGALPLILEDE